MVMAGWRALVQRDENVATKASPDNVWYTTRCCEETPCRNGGPVWFVCWGRYVEDVLTNQADAEHMAHTLSAKGATPFKRGRDPEPMRAYGSARG